MMEHTTVAQNRAHRADLVWVKVGRSEYLRSDGVTIRKMPHGAWWVFLPSGERAAYPYENVLLPATGHSLTWAKFEAERITTDSPAYVEVGR